MDLSIGLNVVVGIYRVLGLVFCSRGNMPLCEWGVYHSLIVGLNNFTFQLKGVHGFVLWSMQVTVLAPFGLGLGRRPVISNYL